VAKPIPLPPPLITTPRPDVFVAISDFSLCLFVIIATRPDAFREIPGLTASLHSVLVQYEPDRLASYYSMPKPSPLDDRFD
jgi:hypothetical protein